MEEILGSCFIYISNSEIKSDYTIFIDVPEEYSALEQIDITLRNQISEYMKENNLILSNGEQTFCRRSFADFDELIDDFNFTKIQD